MAHAQQHAQHPRPTGRPDQTPPQYDPRDPRNAPRNDAWLNGGGGSHQPYSYRGPGDPYATPPLGENQQLGQVGQRARPSQQLGQQMGQPARASAALQRRALNMKTEFQVIEACERCGGTGELEDYKPACGKCYTEFEPEQLASRVPFNWRGGRLPCGHSLDHQIQVLSPVPCPTCAHPHNIERYGKGRLPRRITMGEHIHYLVRNETFRNFMYDFFIDIYEDLYGPSERSAEMRAVHAQQFDRSDAKPTAPPVHITSAPTQLTSSMLPPLPPSDIPSKF